MLIIAGSATLRRGYSEPPASNTQSNSDTLSGTSNNRRRNTNPYINLVLKEEIGPVNIDIDLTFNQKLKYNI